MSSNKLLTALPAEDRDRLSPFLTTIPIPLRLVLYKQGAPIEARALHAYHSQESLEALLLLEQIAERAMLRGDETAAINALRRGLDLSRRELYRGELDDPMRAMAIFGRKLGEALTQAGNYADAEGVLREALDMTGPSGTDRTQILAALARCTGPAAQARGARAQR